MSTHDVRRADAPSVPRPGMAYQPIVDLRSGEVVAFEALARGPQGSATASPAAMFAVARAEGHLVELDWACRTAALEGARQAGLAPPYRLFVNAEPEAMAAPCPDYLRTELHRAQEGLRPILEITERALTADPAGLLAAVADARSAGWGIALDDVGAEPASLALMPFLAPDVIKLDLRLVQDRTTAEVAGIVNAVLAQAERTGARILAEGIETDDHLRRARALGASLGQGWMLGLPGQLRVPHVPLQHAVVDLVAERLDEETPFVVTSRSRSMQVATKELLLPLSHHLERQAVLAAEPPVLLSTFEHVAHFTPGTRVRYERLARSCAFVAALGAGMPADPVAGVRGADLAADDALAGEWVVTCVGPHFAGALIAKDLGDHGPDRQRRFAFTVTYDRPLVVAAARSLLRRVVAAA